MCKHDQNDMSYDSNDNSPTGIREDGYFNDPNDMDYEPNARTYCFCSDCRVSSMRRLRGDRDE